jgi:hypothetical protein
MGCPFRRQASGSGAGWPQKAQGLHPRSGPCVASIDAAGPRCGSRRGGSSNRSASDRAAVRTGRSRALASDPSAPTARSETSAASMDAPFSVVHAQRPLRLLWPSSERSAGAGWPQKAQRVESVVEAVRGVHTRREAQWGEPQGGGFKPRGFGPRRRTRTKSAHPWCWPSPPSTRVEASAASMDAPISVVRAQRPLRLLWPTSEPIGRIRLAAKGANERRSHGSAKAQLPS